MKLWLITQLSGGGYAVVAAKTELDARNMNPYGGRMDWINNDPISLRWASAITQIKATHLGEGRFGLQEGVICASLSTTV